jgi:tetratricopeptide repeat protein
MGEPVQESGGPSGDERAWREHLEAGQQARRQQQRAEAVRHFEAALWEAERFGPQDPRLVESLLQLSTAYTWPRGQSGGPERAEPLLRRALAIQERTLGPEHPEVAACLLRLAQLYTLQRRPPAQFPDYARAEPLLRRALVILDRAPAPTTQLHWNTVRELATACEHLGHHTEAEALLRRAPEMWQHQPEHPNISNSLLHLAYFYQRLGRWDPAEAALRQALALRDQALADRGQKPGLATAGVTCILVMLAGLYRSQRRWAEAERCLRRAQALAETPGPNDWDRISSRLGLAAIRIADGRYPEAEELLRQALALQENPPGRSAYRFFVQGTRQLSATLLHLTGRGQEALAIETGAVPAPHPPGSGAEAVPRRLVMPPPPEETPEFVWISALTVGDVRESSAQLRWQITGEAATWHTYYANGIISGSGSGRGERQIGQPLSFSPHGPWIGLEAFAAAAEATDLVTTRFVPARPARPTGAPRIEVESRLRLFGHPTFAEAELRFVNRGDGDAHQVRLDPPAPARGWELLAGRAGAEPLPEPLELGRIGTGGSGVLLLRLCRRSGVAPPSVSVRGTYTDAAGAARAI